MTELTRSEILKARHALDHVLEQARTDNNARTGQIHISGGFVDGKPLIEISFERLEAGAPKIWSWGRSAGTLAAYIPAIQANWNGDQMTAYHYLQLTGQVEFYKPFLAWALENEVPDFATAGEWDMYLLAFDSAQDEADQRATQSDALGRPF